MPVVRNTPSSALLFVLATMAAGCGDDSGSMDAGALRDAGAADPDTGPRDVGVPGDGGGPGASLADALRGSPDVTASSSLEAVERGRVACEDDTGRSCLAEPCPFPAGCVVLADFVYESTPSTDTDGPNLRIHALFAQRVGEGDVAGAAPVMLFNHGGGSIGTDSLVFIGLAAAEGYAVVASHFRGSGGSDGEIEGCLGEVDDVVALAAFVAAAAPTQPRVMAGGSHGGCVALGALHAGVDVRATAALWPGADGARRYAYNQRLAAPDSELARAAATCEQAATEHRFVVEGLLGPADARGGLPDWDTKDYRCDDPAFAPRSPSWDGLEDLEREVCRRSPLSTATHLDDGYAGDLLIVHGERDPYIEYTESCHYVQQAGRFQARRSRDDGTWGVDGNPCDGLVTLTDGAPPMDWAGDRHFVLVQPLGHGDSGRPSLGDPCDPRRVDEPDVLAMVFDYLATKLR